MRTLDPILQAALNNGAGDFFVRAYIWNGVSYSEKEVLAFEIDNLTANVTVPFFNSTPIGWFYIQRGLKVEGVEYPINSSKYRTTNVEVSNPRRITYHGNIFWDLIINTPGDVAVETAISEVMDQSVSGITDYVNTADYGDNAEWWHGIQFFPAGKQVLLNSAKRLEPLLKQKYLAQICDIGGNIIKIIGSSQYFEVAPDFALIETDLVKLNWKIQSNTTRKFIWKDEAQTTHEQDETGPLHNFGYIESTVTPILDRSNANLTIIQSMPNLAMTNGDAISIDTWPDGDEFGIPILIKEIFNPKVSPSWYYELRAIEWTSNSEGGAMPSTIERISNYTPLNTSTFNNNLNETHNNLQALAEAVDNLVLGGTPYTPPATTAANDVQVGDGAGAWIKKTLAQFIAIIGLSNVFRLYDSVDPTQIVAFDLTEIPTATTISLTMPSASGSLARLEDLTSNNINHDPAVSADWDTAADPIPGNSAFDELAQRLRDLEGAGSGGVGDGWEADANTWTYSSGVRSQAYTNDPAAGALITLNMTNTSGLLIGDKVRVSSSAGTEDTWIVAIVANTSIQVSALTLNHTTTTPLVTLIESVFVVSVNADMTAILQPGDRVKFTQTTVKYFLVHAVGSYSGGVTLITIYGGTDYTVVDAAISSPSYSYIKAPFGFPTSPAKWTTDYTDTASRVQSSPTVDVWYSILGNLNVAIPIGAWKVKIKWVMYINKTSTVVGVYSTLSSTTNSETDPGFTSFGSAGGSSANLSMYQTINMIVTMTIAAKTPFYPLIRTANSSVASIRFENNIINMIISLESGYL